MSEIQSTLDSNLGMLELTVLNAEAFDGSFDEFVIEGMRNGLPPEILTRLKSLWEITKQVGDELIHVGKIVIAKLIEFLKKHPKLTASLALGAAVFLLSSTVPVLGPILAPLLAVVTTIYAFGSSSSFDEIIKTAKNFFALIIEIFNAVTERWLSSN